MPRNTNTDESYDFRAIESKWQKRWRESGVFHAKLDPSRPKFYLLIEFPYPSGAGLHVGHPRSYSALDAVARKRRMQGYNVLFPIGWDAFGLPTENFAIQTGRHPRLVTEANVANYRRQLESLGFSFDWSRVVNTTDPAYYKWTQWIFLKLFEKGLAYKSRMPINWCTSCKVGLANEEVVDGVCERCGGDIVRRERNQWMLEITAYAERLLQDLEEVDFLEKIKTQQRNWIGRSRGAELAFPVVGFKNTEIEVFTTRPDTLFGATFMVLSPEHPLIDRVSESAGNTEEIRAYREAAARKSDFERTELIRTVAGVEIQGVLALNPATQQEIPIWIADYVLISYGTGAIMSVPGHDERDHVFARKYGLPIVEVVSGGNVDKAAYSDNISGTLVNSGFLNGMKPPEAIEAMIQDLESRGVGHAKVQYRLRDWVFSRQRYWGEPIPLIDCPSCGWVPVPESELPLTLPEVEKFQTTETGESPLALVRDWVETVCPRCGGSAERETDTMPQWAGSSWYFLRYVDPGNAEALASPEAIEYWMPVDWYNGGMEHTTLHLLYSRFWHKFLFDIGVVPTPEPYMRRTSHGLVLGDNGEKMAKSRGNVVNPDDVVERYGADAMRLFEMFMGAFDQPIPWSSRGLVGMVRFLGRVHDLRQRVDVAAPPNVETERRIHQTIKQVDERMESIKFNTAIAALMSLTNHLGAQGKLRPEDFERLILLVSPFAPHLAEELWQGMGHSESLAYAPWPEFDGALAAEETLEIPVQVNGRLRAKVVVPVGTAVDEVERAACAEVAAHTAGREVKKVIVVGGERPKLVNIVVT